MKFVATCIALAFIGNAAYAQPEIIKEAIVYSTTTITAVDNPNEDLSQVQAGGNERMRMFRNFAEGETKTTAYIKNAMVKTDFKSETIRGSIIRDNDKKATTSLMQIMGRKTGTYVTDEEQENMIKRMDSTMQERAKTDTALAKRLDRPKTERKASVIVTEETKKIAGYTCKKAYIVNTNFLGQKDSMAVWFTPDIKFEYVDVVGGPGAMGGMMMRNNSGNSQMDAFKLIDGFVMQYETKQRNTLMEVKVTKIDTGKKIEDKEFDIPKGYDVKPMAEMQSRGNGSGRVIMFGSGSGH